ncbi:dermokine isoform X1 [Mustela putorius furo]|uniref:Dermokine isoform X1 n=1 Tax=Mustela putorius furo TaxID=9669 RepID=A0A8U0N3N9_MUSPF|nr:dermokine isoform X1 [Mustela putorius furo]
MKSQGSLACLLLALCLGSGEAGPLLRGGERAAAGAGDALGHGVGHAIGQGVGDAISHGVEEAVGQGAGEAAGSVAREVMGHGMGEAARALGNTGGEAGRQAENIIRRGEDALHSSWQGMPGSNGAWGTGGQPPSGGHGIFGSQGGSGVHSQGNSGGPGTPWGQGYPRGPDGSFGTHSQGGSWGQGGNGGSFSSGTNAQGTVVQPGYGSVRGSNSHTECTNPPPSGSGGSSSNFGGGSGGSSGSDSGSGSGGSGGGNGHGGSSGSGSSGSGSSGGSNSGGSGGSNSGGGSSGGSNSYGPSWDRPLENSRNFQSGSSGSQGYNTGSSWGSSGGGSGSGNKPGCDNPGNEVRISGGSGGQGFGGQGGSGGYGDLREISKEGSRLVGGPQDNYQWQGPSGRGEAVSGINTLNSQTSPGIFNFDTFWKNFKSKLGFINWDAINKGQVPRPSTRALLYFSRLWEDFKHNTPFLNWKAIIEGADASLQKRSGGARQSGGGWQEVAAVTSKNTYNQQAYPTSSGGQYSAKIPSKGITTPSSSASRVRPGLLQWVKFW